MKEKISELQGEILGTAQKVWFAGLGALSMAGDEGNKLFSDLVEKGKNFETKASPVSGVKDSAGKAKGKVDDIVGRLENSLTDKVAGVMERLGVPTQEEISQLYNRVDALTEAVNKMLDAKEDAAKAEAAEDKPAEKKTTARRTRKAPAKKAETSTDADS